MANQTVQLIDGSGNNLYPKDSIRTASVQLLNGWSDNGFQLYRIGSFVVCNCSVRYGTGAVIANIPAGFRPANSVLLPCIEVTAGKKIGYTRVRNFADRCELDTDLYSDTPINITSLLVWRTNDD